MLTPNREHRTLTYVLASLWSSYPPLCRAVGIYIQQFQLSTPCSSLAQILQDKELFFFLGILEEGPFLPGCLPVIWHISD